MDITGRLLAAAVRVYRIVSHHLPDFHDRAGSVAESLQFATGRLTCRLLFEFWLKIFGVAFGIGVVSGIVMAFEFGINWSELSRMSGATQGPLLTYETFTAFASEAAFFGVLLFGRQRVRLPPP